MIGQPYSGHGLRREAQRHAAFARTKISLITPALRPHESGVAASALPPQSMTPAWQVAIFIRVY